MNWSRPTDSGSTENARLENRKLFKILFKLLYLRFPPLQISTCVFHLCSFVLAFSVLAFSTLAYSYLRIPYLHIPSSGTFVFRTCVFSRLLPLLFYINFTSTKCVVDAAGVTTVTWTVELLRDSEDEPTEKFKILLRSPSNALLGQLNRAVVHVLNVDNGP